MKKQVKIFSVMLLSLIMLTSGCASTASSGSGSSDKSQGKKITLKYGELNSETNPMGITAKEFAKNVDKLSNGRIKIDLYAGGQLGDEKSMAQMVQMGGGGLDLMRIGSNTLTDFGVDKMALLSLPYIFRDRSHMWSVLNGSIGKDILDEVSKKDTKMVGLMYFDEGARNFFFTKATVKSISDMKGLKIRVPETQILMDTVKAFGASPTPISASELYSSLQTGVIDGAENPLTGYFSSNYFEVAKNVTLDSHTFAPSVLVMSKSVYDKLSDEDKKILNDASAETQKFVKDSAEKNDANVLVKLKDKKDVKIIDVPDKTEWQNAVKPLYKKYGGSNEDLIKKIQDTK